MNPKRPVHFLQELKKNREPLHSLKHTSAEGDSTPMTDSFS
jgi:hypothetical protein